MSTDTDLRLADLLETIDVMDGPPAMTQAPAPMTARLEALRLTTELCRLLAKDERGYVGFPGHDERLTDEWHAKKYARAIVELIG